MALAKTPDVFAAGAEFYGMPDLVMDYLLSKSRFGDWYETEMGNPRRDAALFRERSPLPYLEDVKAPLLVFQGANDSNVPKAESDLLVAVLKELQKPYEYVVYDDEGHGFTRRKNVLDSSKRHARRSSSSTSGEEVTPLPFRAGGIMRRKGQSDGTVQALQGAAGHLAGTGHRRRTPRPGTGGLPDLARLPYRAGRGQGEGEVQPAAHRVARRS